MADIPDDLDGLMDTLKKSGPEGYPEALKAKIAAALAKQFVSVLDSLRQSIDSFQKDIGKRSEAANKHSRALVSATVVLAIATVVLVIATGFMASVGYFQLRAAQQETQSHIEPEMSLEIVNDDGGKAIISNDGVSPLVKVLVESDTAIFLGPPFNRISSRLTTGRRIPGKEGGWWQIKELEPGEVQARSIQDVTDNAFRLRKMLAEAKASGQMGGISPKAKVDLRILLRFRMTVHRQVDNRQFNIERLLELSADSHTGKPILWDFELMRYTQPDVEKILKQLSQ